MVGQDHRRRREDVQPIDGKRFQDQDVLQDIPEMSTAKSLAHMYPLQPRPDTVAVKLADINEIKLSSVEVAIRA